jgi:uncharacterized protein YqgV (UPF0045/DUF77 family)
LKTTIELSNYPLNEVYKPIIKDFIKRLNKNPNFTVITTATSTQVSGDYDEVMRMMQQEIKTSFEKYGKAVFVMKVLKGDLL